MGKNQAYKAMQRARVGSSSAGPEEVEDGMVVTIPSFELHWLNFIIVQFECRPLLSVSLGRFVIIFSDFLLTRAALNEFAFHCPSLWTVDGSFHSPEWHAARLASLKTSHTVTWEEFKRKQKEDELKKGELEADKDRMMREYRAQLDAERASKLAHGRNHGGSKSSHKKDRKEKDLKKRSSKKRKTRGYSYESKIASHGLCRLLFTVYAYSFLSGTQSNRSLFLQRSKRRSSESSSSSSSSDYSSSSSDDEEREAKRSKSKRRKERKHKSKSKHSSNSKNNDGPLPLSRFFEMFDEVAFGVPLMLYNGKVLKRDIPWETYMTTKLITGTHLQLLRRYDKRSESYRAALLDDDGPAYVQMFICILRDIQKEDTVEFVLALIDEMLTANPKRARLFHDKSLANEDPYEPFLS
ncbi:hypothetical protein Sjap_006066 [Stephania japonica]|uniref:Uncharacterized protein n=1 Tax=Stephania japonica TaxID=461633 RepID=A0AAP0K6Q7_9MAGN